MEQLHSAHSTGGRRPKQAEGEKKCLIFFLFAFNYELLFRHVLLGWPKHSFEFSHKMLWKSPNEHCVWSSQYIKSSCLYKCHTNLFVSYTLIRLGVGGLICLDCKSYLFIQSNLTVRAFSYILLSFYYISYYILL